MTASEENLPTECLICWDNVASGIQKLLCTRLESNQCGQMEVSEYVRNEVAHVSYEDEVEDNLPDMLAGPIYNKKVLFKYSEGEEDGGKYFVLNILF